MTSVAQGRYLTAHIPGASCRATTMCPIPTATRSSMRSKSSSLAPATRPRSTACWQPSSRVGIVSSSEKKNPGALRAQTPGPSLCASPCSVHEPAAAERPDAGPSCRRSGTRTSSGPPGASVPQPSTGWRTGRIIADGASWRCVAPAYRFRLEHLRLLGWRLFAPAEYVNWLRARPGVHPPRSRSWRRSHSLPTGPPPSGPACPCRRPSR